MKERWNVPHILLLVVSGILIGGGAILPGISGGVLCVVFGIYQPMMELLAHPKSALPKYWRTLLPVGIGWIIGFFGFARVIEWVFGANETIGTWLFIGLILGTMPQLYREAGAKGRSTGSFVAGGIAFAALFGILLFVRLGTFPQVVPSFGWYLFAGVLWGLSLIVPGMTSSSVLMSLGLLVPLSAAIAAFDLPIIGVWLLGLAGTVLILARLVNGLFENHFSMMYHIVLGVTLASTLIIVPVQYADAAKVLLSLLCCAIGIVIAWLLSRLETKKDEAQAELQRSHGENN